MTHLALANHGSSCANADSCQNLRFVDVLHKRSKISTYECPSLIAVLTERLSSFGSWGSVGSIPMPDRTVFMYTESVNVHA